MMKLKERLSSVEHRVEEYQYHSVGHKRLDVLGIFVCLTWLNSDVLERRQIARQVLGKVFSGVVVSVLLVVLLVLNYGQLYRKFAWYYDDPGYLSGSRLSDQDLEEIVRDSAVDLSLTRTGSIVAKETNEVQILHVGNATTDLSKYALVLCIEREDLLRFKEGFERGEFNKLNFAVEDRFIPVTQLTMDYVDWIEREAVYNPQGGVYVFRYLADEPLYGGLNRVSWWILWNLCDIGLAYGLIIGLVGLPVMLGGLVIFVLVWRRQSEVYFFDPDDILKVYEEE